MRYAVTKAPQDWDLYSASGAVGPEAPEGTTLDGALLGRLRKVRGGPGEPSDGQRCEVWVELTNGAGAGGSLASHPGALLHCAHVTVRSVQSPRR